MIVGEFIDPCRSNGHKVNNVLDQENAVNRQCLLEFLITRLSVYHRAYALRIETAACNNKARLLGYPFFD